MEDHEALPKDITPKNYVFTLTPNFESFQFQGDETVEVYVNNAVDRVTVNSLDIRVLEASVSQGSKDFKTVDTVYDHAQETFTILLSEHLEVGPAVVKFKFTGTVNDLMCGFYRSEYEHEGTKHVMGTTQFQSVDARRAFLCWDEPAVKATFEISLVIPKDLEALSNMPVADEHDLGDGTKRVHFARTPRMSTYILAFSIGKFEYVEGRTREGVRVRVYTTPGKKEMGRFSLGIATETLSYFNDYFGCPFPLNKIDMIGVPDFAAGAMENWGLITYREIALLVDEKQTPAARRMRVAETVAHELAHQWFGNLVTMEWWTHLWLNEGFATWVASLALDKLFPQWRIWELFLTGSTSSALGLDALESSHPIEVPVSAARKIDEVFDEISYSKGGSVIRMISSFLGEDTFRAGLRTYLKRHEYGNATTTDLWKALAEASGKPVEAIMASWTGYTGFPVITVRTEGHHLVLKQQRFLTKGVQPASPHWIVPITVLSSDGRTGSFMLDSVEGRFPFAVPAGGWIKLNIDQAGFYRVHYEDPALFAALCAALQQPGQLSSMDRYGVVSDAIALAQAKLMPTAAMLKILHSCRHDDSYMVLRAVQDAMYSVLRVFFNLPNTPQLQSFGRDVLKPALQRLGWTVKAGEDHQTTLLRAELINSLSSVDDEETVRECLRLFADPDHIEPDIRQSVFIVAAAHGGVSVVEKLIGLYHAATLSEHKVRVLRALAHVRESAAIHKALEFCKDDAVRSQDLVFLFSGLGRNPWAGTAAWQFMKDNWDMFQKRYGKGGFLFSDMCSSAIEEFHTRELHDEAQKFFREHPATSAEKAIAQALETIQLNTAWRERDSNSLLPSL